MAVGELGDAKGNDVKVVIERLQLFKEKPQITRQGS
jgi:hypothetical protein